MTTLLECRARTGGAAAAIGIMQAQKAILDVTTSISMHVVLVRSGERRWRGATTRREVLPEVHEEAAEGK
jgi:hypothetical protein